MLPDSKPQTYMTHEQDQPSSMTNNKWQNVAMAGE